MIIALAGRRIDAADTKQPKFPLAKLPEVTNALRNFFLQRQASVLVSSAACGADLLAQTEAGNLGLRRRVVIPLSRDAFRQTSVVDRPGYWGPLYDRLMDEVEASGDVIVLQNLSGEEAYSAANSVILENAISLGRALGQAVCALLVWDGVPSGEGDHTEGFKKAAQERRLSIFEIRTG